MPKFVDVVKNAVSTTTLTGEELFPIIQNGVTKKISIVELQNGPFVGATSPNILHSVIGVPSASLGEDGDYAIDTYYKLFYGPKANGVWPVGFSIVGATGAVGAAGANGADGADGVGVPAGGTANQILAKIDGTDYNTEWVNPPSYIIDVTSASPDYALPVGATAKVTYSSATSTPLNIATTDGLYEVYICGDCSASVTNDNLTSLNPNNTTYASGAIEYYDIYKDNSLTAGAAAGNPADYVDNNSHTTFYISSGVVVSAKLIINTHVKSKSIRCERVNYLTSSNIRCGHLTLMWNDSSTNWTSLGTLTFPFAQSGTIFIKRIA